MTSRIFITPVHEVAFPLEQRPRRKKSLLPLRFKHSAGDLICQRIWSAVGLRWRRRRRSNLAISSPSVQRVISNGACPRLLGLRNSLKSCVDRRQGVRFVFRKIESGSVKRLAYLHGRHPLASVDENLTAALGQRLRRYSRLGEFRRNRHALQKVSNSRKRLRQF